LVCYIFVSRAYLLGLSTDVISKIQSTLTIKTLEELRTQLPNSDVVKQFDLLWELAKAYGFEDWIQFDASVVRGLAYYTGIVFEGFDRAGELRAICGGGRYDRLLTTYGARQDIPAVGFGFGDCVIVELLKEKNLLPDLPPSLDDIIIPFDESLRPAACQVATKLREQGRSVDIILSNKKIVWYVC
jgi:histidyl-tRNA synthetase